MCLSARLQGESGADGETLYHIIINILTTHMVYKLTVAVATPQCEVPVERFWI